jgi:hypothetical protein
VFSNYEQLTAFGAPHSCDRRRRPTCRERISKQATTFFTTANPDSWSLAIIREADPNRWYAEQFANGCMILTPSFGPVFVTKSDEDLQFLSRGALLRGFGLRH